MCKLLLTRVFLGTEGTLFTPSDAKQAAAFSVCSSAVLKGLCAYVVPLQTLPANIHVHIVVRVNGFWEIE